MYFLINSQLNKLFQNPISIGNIAHLYSVLLRIFLQIGMCRAVINEPCADADAVLRFTAGLVVAVPFDAEITSLPSLRQLRVKVRYPDQTTVMILPKQSDLRPLVHGDPSSGHRLLTTVLLSHQVSLQKGYYR